MNNENKNYKKRQTVTFAITILLVFVVAATIPSANAYCTFSSMNGCSSNPLGHFWTTSVDEANAYARDGWKIEGIAAHIFQNQEPGTVPLYRTHHYGNGGNFWTASWEERSAAINTGSKYELTEGYVFTYPAPGTVPLYRTYDPKENVDGHFYTINHQESLTITKGSGHPEGIAAYVYDNSKSGTIPLYRLYHVGGIQNQIAVPQPPTVVPPPNNNGAGNVGFGGEFYFRFEYNGNDFKEMGKCFSNTFEAKNLSDAREQADDYRKNIQPYRWQEFTPRQVNSEYDLNHPKCSMNEIITPSASNTVTTAKVSATTKSLPPIGKTMAMDSVPCTSDEIEKVISQKGINYVKLGWFNSDLGLSEETKACLQRYATVAEKYGYGFYPLVQLSSDKQTNLKMVNEIFAQVENPPQSTGIGVIDDMVSSLYVNSNTRWIVNMFDGLSSSSNTSKVLVLCQSCLYDKKMSPEDLIEVIQYAKQKAQESPQNNIRIATMESPDIWLSNPELAQAVDVILYDDYPFWMGLPIDQVYSHLSWNYARMLSAYPDKQIIVETQSYPVSGDAFLKAIPSTENDSAFRDVVEKVRKYDEVVFFLNEDTRQEVKMVCALEESDGSVMGPTFGNVEQLEGFISEHELELQINSTDLVKTRYTYEIKDNVVNLADKEQLK